MTPIIDNVMVNVYNITILCLRRGKWRMDDSQTVKAPKANGHNVMIITLIICGLILSIGAICIVAIRYTDVRNRVVTSDNLSTTLEAIGKSRLKSEDKEVFARAAMRNTLGGTFAVESIVLEGKTVGAIIREQRSFEAAQKAAEDARILAEKQARQEYEKQVARLRNQVSLMLLDKTSHPIDSMNGIYSEYVALKFKITNNSQKTIRGLQGSIMFKDIFGNLIKETGFTYDTQNIPPSKSIVYNASLDINQFIDEDKRLYEKALKDLTCEFNPNQIIYSDGEVIRADMPTQLE
jgi:hypothetical protein